MFIYLEDDSDNIIAAREDGIDLKIPVKYTKIEVEKFENENKYVKTGTKKSPVYTLSYVEPEVVEPIEEEATQEEIV